ncbi:MAG: TetR/AcrR family transcriptional regulator [Acidimicrobiales bacterium]|jgi:AcrR family transcriptional regulator
MVKTEANSEAEEAAGADRARAPRAEPGETRERILDIALDLFTTKGYDKTSLREIAEQLGFSKAAIYYHFASKEEILLALHLRLHEFGREALESIAGSDVSPQVWARLLDGLIDQMLQQRALFIFHERNQAAIEDLHRREHDGAHEDLQARFREILSNPDIALELRVRMACALGAVMGGLVMAGDVFAEATSKELGDMLRGAVGDLLGPR